MADFCFRSRICLQSVASADRAETIFPRSPMCGNWWLFFLLSSKSFMNTSVILFPGVLFLHLWNSVASSLLGITFLLHATSYSDALNPIMFLFCNCKINNIYILLFQDLDFCFLWYILYSAVALIYWCFKTIKTSEMECLCAYPVCHSNIYKIIFIKT